MLQTLYFSSIFLSTLSIIGGCRAQLDPGSYAAKVNQPCPQQLIRSTPTQNQTLNAQEAAYVASRKLRQPRAWRDWIGDGRNIGYDLDAFQITSNNGSGLPTIGIAASGGGYRAAQNGAGVIAALDIRNETSRQAGTGGLFQVATYMSGLSGGSWLLASLLFHDFPGMHALFLGDTDKGGNLNGWHLDKDLWRPAAFSPLDEDNQHWYGSLMWSVNDKGRLGLDTSLTDIWSRALSYHVLSGLGEVADTQTTTDNFFSNETSHGAGILWSDIPDIPSYSNFSLPLPIVVACVKPNNFSELHPDTPLFLNTTQYEFTPYEMGSFDPNLSSFLDIRYLGTQVKEGSPKNSTACVTEFDQASFIFGTSSSLFDQIVDRARSEIDKFDPQDQTIFLDLLRRMLDVVTTRNDQVANYPNPFQGINPGVYGESNVTWMSLVDGSTAKENIPLGPLLVKSRGLDMIVAIDTSANDDNNWPDATSMFSSKERVETVSTSIAQSFPPMPNSTTDFVNFGLNRRTTFLGCDPTQSPPEYPLIVYIPNQPPADGSDPVTNTGTFKLQYSQKHTSRFLDQSQQATMAGFMPGKTGADPDFGLCLQCAAIDRSRLKVTPNIPRSSFCTNCFQKYCYDPQNPPSGDQIVGRKLKFKDPDPFFFVTSFIKARRNAIIVGTVFGVVCGILMALGLCWWHKKRSARKHPAGSTGPTLVGAPARGIYHPIDREESEWSIGPDKQQYEMTAKQPLVYEPPYSGTFPPPSYPPPGHPPPSHEEIYTSSYNGTSNK